MAYCPRAQCYRPFTLRPETSPATSGAQLLYLCEGQHRGFRAPQRQPPGLPRMWVPTPNLMEVRHGNQPQVILAPVKPDLSGSPEGQGSAGLDPALETCCGRACLGPCCNTYAGHSAFSGNALPASGRMSGTCPNGMESRQRIKELAIWPHLCWGSKSPVIKGLELITGWSFRE